MAQRSGRSFSPRSGNEARSAAHGASYGPRGVGYGGAGYNKYAAPSAAPVNAPASYDGYSRYSGSYGGSFEGAPAGGKGPVPSGRGRSCRPLVTVAVAAACLLLGFLLCFVLLGGSLSLPNAVSAALSERNLDQTVATYRFEGKLYEVSAREVMCSSSRIADYRNDDGSYDVPTAEEILACVRNGIMGKVVAERGVSVSDAEVSSYAQSVFGTADYAAIAQTLGMDEEYARVAVGEAAAVNKLRASVSTATSSEPVAPAAPADGDPEVGNSAYFDYIVSLLGSHWDSAHGTWADTSNPYYPALKDAVFAPGSASYNAAQAAYSVAYSLYSAGSGSQGDWSSFVNGSLKSSSIRILTLGV